MLQLTVVTGEGFDEATNKFIEPESFDLALEHSLVSLSKWEEIWEVPFIGNEEKTSEQILSYIMCMDLRGNFTQELFPHITEEQFIQIKDYINAKKTATTVTERPGPPSHQIVTSELIYYWMIALNIPVEFETWHLNRLLMLIKVCNIQNGKGDPKNKMSPAEAAAQRRALNEQRRREWGSRG
jgi:hypothetical protein